MSSFRVFNQQVQRVGVLVALLVATIVPALVPSLAAAATVTERSVALSSSSKAATGVTYTVNFKPVVNAGAFVVDFCNDSPLIGQTCTAPAGMVTSSATSATVGFTDVEAVTNGGDHNTLRVVGSMTAGNAVSVELSGITNPSTAGPLYVRILTFTDATGAEAYTSTTPGTHLDEGGAAASITDTVGVSGAVLESMIFCAASEAITPNCGDASTHLPTVKLGTTVGNTTVLDSADTYEGTVYTQISTNAVNGATVYLKSNTTGCGGLVREGAASFAAGCGIGPALAAGINDGDALFGVKTGTAAAAAGATSPSGTVRPYDGGSGAYYNNTAYKMNWVSGDASGVTSPYGDPFLDTNNAPVNNMGMPITFAASASNTTPAGKYSAAISLIATGKF